MGHQSLHECNYGNSMHHAMGKDGDPQNAARVQLWKANAAYRARSTKINLISEKRGTSPIATRMQQWHFSKERSQDHGARRARAARKSADQADCHLNHRKDLTGEHWRQACTLCPMMPRGSSSGLRLSAGSLVELNALF